MRLSLPITLQEAILGGKITIPMPSGDVSLKIPAGTNTGQTLRLKGKGLDGGDLYVSPVITLQNPKDKALLDWAKTGGSSEVIGSHGASLRKGLTR